MKPDILVLAADTPSPMLQEYVTPLMLVAVGCAGLAAALIIAVALLSRPARHKAVNIARGSHSALTNKAIWHARIDTIVESYEQGNIDRDEAFRRLAGVARDFASIGFHRNMSNHTLADLQDEPRLPSNRRGLDLLRQTIGALYPPEFADAHRNDQARETTVEQASAWVATLVERWR